MFTINPIIIECYDNGIRICDDEKILADSASFALIETSRHVTVGPSAQQQAHLRPREVSTTFWSDLSANSTTKHVVSNAELALNHLHYVLQQANCSDQDAIVITPATFDKHHLGLLLGICEKLPIKIVGIVCNATLAMQGFIDDCKAVYLDLLQRKLVLTELIHSNSGVELKTPSRIFDYGLQDFVHNIAKLIADKFVAETRFDPLHIAKHEQQLFDKLPLWLNMLKNTDSTECNLSTEDESFSINISQQQLQQANHQQFDKIAAYLNVLFHNHDAIAIYCSSSCQQVFGMQNFFSNLPGCAVIQLEDDSLAKNALLNKDEIISKEQVLYVNSLPWHSKFKPDTLSFNPGKISNLSSLPTHILIDGHAYGLQQDIYIAHDRSSKLLITLEQTSESLCKISSNNLSVDVEILNSIKIQMNSISVENNVHAKIGDTLAVQDCLTHCRFIKVVEHEA